MKKIWKALGLAAIAAAVPVRFKKDEATGKKTYQSLLLSVDVGPGEDGVQTDIGINLGEGLLTDAMRGLAGAKKEKHLFADDDPDAAVVEPIPAVDGEEAAPDSGSEPAAEPAPETATEEEATEEEATEEEATEEDFDPEL